jgi:hypothetical protein
MIPYLFNQKNIILHLSFWICFLFCRKINQNAFSAIYLIFHLLCAMLNLIYQVTPLNSKASPQINPIVHLSTLIFPSHQFFHLIYQIFLLNNKTYNFIHQVFSLFTNVNNSCSTKKLYSRLLTN